MTSSFEWLDGMEHTSFIVQLLQHLSNDLSDRLDRFEIFLGLIVVVVKLSDVETHCE
jgi:hypothetical protein